MNSRKYKSFSYRADIDGLRAFAVLVVVLFHLGVEALEGGFIGVDVFFVISGFLITGIIAPKIKLGRFALGNFYKRRVIRLLPPSLAMIIGTFIAALFILDPVDLIAFAQSATASTLSVSNIYFFLQAGYWDTSSELKPLLHTWSLGAEEQFYLLWPAFIIGLAKLPAKIKMGAVIAVVMVLGTMLSEYMVRVNPDAAFYLLPARVFQFAFGATCLFISQSETVKSWLSPLLVRDGLTLIALTGLVGTVLLFDGSTLFPGINGLVPCAFTGLLLVAGGVRKDGERENLRSVILENPLSLWIGRMSYSMYLVHWPIVAFLRYQHGPHLSVTHIAFAAGLTVLLTLILYFGIERRFSARSGMKTAATGNEDAKGRNRIQPREPQTRIPAIIVTGVFILASSSVVIWQNGLSWRSNKIVYTADVVKAGVSSRFDLYRDSTLCMVDMMDLPKCEAAQNATILVMGNSHAMDGVNILRGMDESNLNRRFLGISSSLCDFTWDVGDKLPTAAKEACQKTLDDFIALDRIDDLKTVVYSSNKPYSTNKSSDLAVLQWLRMRRPDLTIVTIEGFINLNTDCYRLINEDGPGACFKKEHIDFFPNHVTENQLRAEFKAVSDIIISKVELLCSDPSDPTTCLTTADNGEPALWDGNHLSKGYANTIGRKLAKECPEVATAIFKQNKD